MSILITGGAGFIGSNFALSWLKKTDEKIVNVDKLTYAGNVDNLADLKGDNRHRFIKGDIGDSNLVLSLLRERKPRAIINFAAETHVDRSISGPESFVQTNCVGTFRLLESARVYREELEGEAKEDFRFLHVSTDEVYGTLAKNDPAFSETHPHLPNSPYSASKAAADHMVRAYRHTYGLPVLTTNCSNNHGPFQFPEKLIPLIIHNALGLKPLPVYGDGLQIRDWLYVEDHCDAIRAVLAKGKVGEVYNVGGKSEKTNIEIVRALCDLLDELKPPPSDSPVSSYRELITFVKDRPGHDRRYAINSSKIEKELGWFPAETFETGLRKTVEWYLNNQKWTARVADGEYHRWIEKQYAQSA